MKTKRQSKRLPLLLLAGLLSICFIPAVAQAPKLLPSDLKPQVQQFMMFCTDGESALADLLLMVQATWGEQVEFSGILPTGIRLFVTTNDKRKSFSIIGINNGGKVCMIFAGGQWQQWIKPEIGKLEKPI